MGAGRRPARQQLHPSLSLLVEEPGSFPIVGGIKDLARSLRCTKEEALNALGASRSHRKVHVKLLGGKSYSFPVKEPVLVPFEDASRAAEELGRGPLRFIDTEPSPVVVSGEEQGRRPVVVLLGHADHGKTTLLDQLSGSGRAIAGREAANMTQELRAMQVSIDDAYSVTVLDTPGQEIFHRMRSNGARVADAVILVVAADRGVEQETGECVGLLDEMGVPAVLALTKADLAEPAAVCVHCAA
jgi:small GTP-binding protein